MSYTLVLMYGIHLLIYVQKYDDRHTYKVLLNINTEQIIVKSQTNHASYASTDQRMSQKLDLLKLTLCPSKHLAMHLNHDGWYCITKLKNTKTTIDPECPDPVPCFIFEVVFVRQRVSL